MSARLPTPPDSCEFGKPALLGRVHATPAMGSMGTMAHGVVVHAFRVCLLEGGPREASGKPCSMQWRWRHRWHKLTHMRSEGAAVHVTCAPEAHHLAIRLDSVRGSLRRYCKPSWSWQVHATEAGMRPQYISTPEL